MKLYKLKNNNGNDSYCVSKHICDVLLESGDYENFTEYEINYDEPYDLLSVRYYGGDCYEYLASASNLENALTIIQNYLLVCECESFITDIKITKEDIKVQSFSDNFIIIPVKLNKLSMSTKLFTSEEIDTLENKYKIDFKDMTNIKNI